MKKSPRLPFLVVLAAAALAAILFLSPARERIVRLFGHDGNADTALVLYGNIDIREADLAFNVAGRIDRMLVEEGDRVEPGQLLAELEDETYQAELNAAAARAAAADAVLARLLSGSRPEEVAKARAEVAAIEASLKDARGRLVRTEELTRKAIATQQRLDEDRTRVVMLEAQMEAAKQALSLAIQGPRDEDIAQARAQLEAEQAALALARQRHSYTRLFAREAGIVNTRILEPGAVVLPQSPVYSIALSDPVWARVYAPERELGRIVPGMTAQVFTDSAPDRPYTGWVGFVSPVAEFTPKSVETEEIRSSLVYRMRVYVRNPDDALRQGMPVTVRLVPGT